LAQDGAPAITAQKHGGIEGYYGVSQGSMTDTRALS
jgi:hypothetical protein